MQFLLIRIQYLKPQELFEIIVLTQIHYFTVTYVAKYATEKC